MFQQYTLYNNKSYFKNCFSEIMKLKRDTIKLRYITDGLRKFFPNETSENFYPEFK